MPSWLWEGHAKCLCWEIKEHHNQKHQRPAAETTPLEANPHPSGSLLQTVVHHPHGYTR